MMSDEQVQSAVGLVALPLLAFAFRERGRALSALAALRVAGLGVLLQIAVAAGLLAVPQARAVFAAIAGVVGALQAATAEGTRLVFGYLGGGPAPFEVARPEHAFLLAFQALPLILLVSALTALFYHWGILQRVVAVFAVALSRSLGVSGPLGTAAAANIFVGMVEAPVLIRPYLARLDRGGLFAVMTVGLATIAGTVLVLYSTVIADTVPDAAGHLLVASVISAPAALTLSHLMVPVLAEEEAAAPGSAAVDGAEPVPAGPIDAVAQGARAGVTLLTSVVAMLVVFVALVALTDRLLAVVAEPFGIEVTLRMILGTVFLPFAWLIGIPWAEAGQAAGLLGLKTVANEFVAYLALVAEGDLSERSRLVMTYALSGFANFGSVGIMIGGLSAMVPARRSEIVGLGFKALLAGTLATLMTGAVIGVITPPGV